MAIPNGVNIPMPRPHGGSVPCISRSALDDKGNERITVQLVGEIGPDTQFLELYGVLDAAKEGDVVEINIDTPGGDVYTTMNIVERMKNSKAKVVTVASGLVASAGTFIWFYGKEKKVERWAEFLFHCSSHGDFGRSLSIQETSTKLVQYMREIGAAMVRQGILTRDEYINAFVNKADVDIPGAIISKRINMNLNKLSNDEMQGLARFAKALIAETAGEGAATPDQTAGGEGGEGGAAGAGDAGDQGGEGGDAGTGDAGDQGAGDNGGAAGGEGDAGAAGGDAGDAGAVEPNPTEGEGAEPALNIDAILAENGIEVPVDTPAEGSEGGSEGGEADAGADDQGGEGEGAAAGGEGDQGGEGTPAAKCGGKKKSKKRRCEAGGEGAAAGEGAGDGDQGGADDGAGADGGTDGGAGDAGAAQGGEGDEGAAAGDGETLDIEAILAENGVEIPVEQPGEGGEGGEGGAGEGDAGAAGAGDAGAGDNGEGAASAGEGAAVTDKKKSKKCR